MWTGNERTALIWVSAPRLSGLTVVGAALSLSLNGENPWWSALPCLVTCFRSSSPRQRMPPPLRKREMQSFATEGEDEEDKA